MVSNADKIIQLAIAAMGIHEEPTGSNDGPALRALLADTPFEPGQPWCYYYALAIMIDAFGGVKNLPDSIAVTGSCNDAAIHAGKLGKFTRDPATGAIFLLPDGNGVWHHAGIVTRVNMPIDPKTGRVEIEQANVRTMEGNTNSNGSREGYGVFAHSRPVASVRFIVW